MEGLADLWTTITNELSFGVLGMAGEDIPDYWAGVAIDWAAIIAGVIVLIYLIVAGIKYITSSGDPGKTEEAQKQIISAIIGLAIVILAYALTRVVAGLFGVEGLTLEFLKPIPPK
ncbi:unnamed protein product [marine sediment metagenome]|uniref:Uncharacterized protein n=1 Tax=marine sediment metagenome TaxID=412755 RepID=X1T898_9ZZZZ